MRSAKASPGGLGWVSSTQHELGASVWTQAEPQEGHQNCEGKPGRHSLQGQMMTSLGHMALYLAVM